MEETGPEALGVAQPKGGKDGLLLEIGIVGILGSQHIHHVTLHIATIGTHRILVMQHAHHRTSLGMLGHLLLMTYQLQHTVSPLVVEQGMTELIQDLLGSLGLAHKHRATGQMHHSLHMPAMLHAILHTQTVTVVQQSVLIVDHTTEGLIQQVEWHGGVALSLTLGETVHLVELAT